MAKISVLMPTYNHVSYIQQAMAGVLAQQCTQPFELLVGDDCSPDGTGVVARRFGEQHRGNVHVHCRTSNVGMHANVHDLFRRSRGEYIAFCEGDDYWTNPAKLQYQCDLLDADPGVSVVIGNFVSSRLYRNNWQVERRRKAFDGLSAGDLRGDLADRFMDGRLRTLTATFRRSVLDNLYAKQLPLEDFPFLDNFLFGQAARDGRIERVDDVVGVYRVTPGSATRGSSEARLKYLLALEDFHSKVPEFFQECGAIPHRPLEGLNRLICMAAFVAGNEGTFTRSLADEILPGPLRAMAFGGGIFLIRHQSARDVILAGWRLYRGAVTTLKLG